MSLIRLMHFISLAKTDLFTILNCKLFGAFVEAFGFREQCQKNIDKTALACGWLDTQPIRGKSACIVGNEPEKCLKHRPH